MLDHITVSAGVRGVQLKISPADLLRAAAATTADLVDETEETSNH